MSLVRYYCAATLDGYIAESDDTLDWLLNYEGEFEGADSEAGQGGYESFYAGIGAMVMGSVLYIPVAVLFWFAPLLVAWHGIPVGKALFFSWMTVWRNRAAFIVYGVLVAILLIAVPLFIDALFASSGANNIAPIIATPYRILVMAVLYCSFYATYRGCFNVTQAAGQTTDTAA